MTCPFSGGGDARGDASDAGRGVGRRNFLRGAAAAVGAAAVGGGAAATLTRDSAGAATAAPAADRVIAFHGAHQAGILEERQAAAAFVALDVTAATRSELADLMKTLTVRSRALMSATQPVNLGISAPEADSGILGPTVPADGLTINLGVGASLFDGRFGLASSKPKQLRPMDTFADDNLDRDRCDGDLLLSICADHADTVVHAVRDLARNTRGGMQVRWRMDGTTPPSRPTGAPRNYLGFKDGTANPATADASLMDKLVWVQAGSGEPAWAAGGSYHVLRTIRMFVEFWDRVDLAEQERMFGRKRDSGAPLTGTLETDLPDYSDDPLGGAIPLDAHIRLANPRTTATDPSRILRRAYNYDQGTDSNGNLDMGLLFNCYQADLDAQFVAVQKRLAGEPLVDYISPVGGGYFFTLPGVTNASDWYARALLS